MARPLRLEFPGAFYHVTARGDRQEPIFEDDADRALFLDLLKMRETPLFFLTLPGGIGIRGLPLEGEKIDALPDVA